MYFRYLDQLLSISQIRCPFSKNLENSPSRKCWAVTARAGQCRAVVGVQSFIAFLVFYSFCPAVTLRYGPLRRWFVMALSKLCSHQKQVASASYQWLPGRVDGRGRPGGAGDRAVTATWWRRSALAASCLAESELRAITADARTFKRFTDVSNFFCKIIRIRKILDYVLKSGRENIIEVMKCILHPFYRGWPKCQVFYAEVRTRDKGRF